MLSQIYCGELERRSIVTALVRRERVRDADRNRRIHRNEIRTPVAVGATALDRSRVPTVLLYFTRLHVRHVRPTVPYP